MANNWRKRITYPFTCRSGNVVQIRRVGPSLALKGTRAARIFEKGGQKILTDIDAQLAFIESLPDAEVEEIYNFARIMLADAIAEPKLYVSPVGEQLSPDDIPTEDFWEIFACVSMGIPGLPVKLKDGETTVEAVENFPEEQAGSAAPVSGGEQIQ